MTVSSTTSRIDYAGNGSTTVFAFPYYFLAESDLAVVRRDDATGVETVLVPGSDFTATGAGAPAGGSVTTAVPPAAGQTLTIRRVVSLSQGTDFVANDPLDAEVLERALDRATMADQQLQEQADRALKFPVGDGTGLSTVLPPAAQRASKNFGFNALGEPVAVEPPVVSSTDLVVVANTAPAHQTGRFWVDTGTLGQLVVKQSDGDDWTELWRVDVAANAFRHQSDVTVASADGGAGAGPLLTLDRASGSPAAADLLGGLALQGRSTTAAARAYARLLARIADATNGSEQGELLFQTIVAGALATRLTLGQGVVIGAPAGGDPGAGKLNAEAVQVNGVAVGGMPRSYLAGLGLANNATDPSNDIDIADGAARADDDAADLVLASPLTKRLDAGWTAGSGQGGLDTGSKAANAWYHVWLIKRSDTGAVDALFSTSATTPVMPSNYDKKRRIGAVKTDGSGNIRGFVQFGDQFWWAISVIDHIGTIVSGSNVALVLSVPSGVRVLANFHGKAANEGVKLYTPGQMVQSSSTVVTLPQSATGSAVAMLPTNTLSQIYAREDGGSSASITIETYGWVDRRGRDE
ncbi:MAG TPA: hypothetical protein VF274_00445 [Alphaproteobacteria bacterium]